MRNTIYADAPAGSPRLLDLRDTGSVGAWAVGEVADRRLVVHPDADPVFVEQYRRLAATLHHVQSEQGIRSVMIASAAASEGKTLTATNLALTLSRSFRKRVLLVDGDLRKPSVHRLLRLQNATGLSDLLKQTPGEPPPAQALSATLAVMTAGTVDGDPVALLVSDAAAAFFAEARARFDWIVVDTPPVVLFPDAGLLASRLDRCVMVVGAGTIASPAAASAVAALGAARILGVVLNRAESSEIAAGYGYGEYGYAESGGRYEQDSPSRTQTR